jgi:hypothetical protein
MTHQNEKPATTNGERASATPTAAANGTAAGRLITRAQAAKILGWGYNTVKRREGVDLHPVRDAHGVFWFREEEVRALARRLQQSEVIEHPAKHYDGATAARVFAMLDEGRGIADIIVALELHPTIARDIAHEWADLRGALIIGGETLARFPTFPCMFFAEPVRTEADLIEALETADAQHCDLCERNAPHFCLFCFVHRHREIVALAKEEQAREKARVDERYKRRIQVEAQKTAARAATSRPTERGVGDATRPASRIADDGGPRQVADADRAVQNGD